MRTFVINMQTAKERLKFMDKQLSSLWIEYEVFPAFIWKNLTKEEIWKYYDKEKSVKTLWEELTLWEIWCALSHMWIYKKMVDDNIPIALVLEDDAIINPRIKNIYDKMWKMSIKQLNSYFDYMTMNYSLINFEKFVNYIKSVTKKFIKERKIFKLFIYLIGSLVFFILDQLFNLIGNVFWPIIVPKYKPLYLAWWYFITLSWAKKLLWVNDKIFVQADLIQELFYKKIWLKFWCVFPLLVKQNDGFKTQIIWRDNLNLNKNISFEE